MNQAKARLFTLAAILGAGVLLLAAGQDAKPFVGDWAGAIDIAGQTFDIALHFKMDQEKLAGTVDVPAQGATGLPLEGIAIEGRGIAFFIAGVPGEPRFEGTLDEAGTAMSGSFTQSGYEGTFAVKAVKQQ